MAKIRSDYMTSPASTLTLPVVDNTRNTDNASNRIAIIDIGSNTVRMVVYDAPARLPVPIFNERVVCGLGKGIGKSGKLNAEGVERALSALDRFCALAREMRVDQFRMVATAAVRDSEDGQTFADLVRDRCGFPVEVLSGREEARLGAVGILGGLPHADGLFGDMGGGSLDLANLSAGHYQDSRTLPLGHLRITEDSDGDVRKARLLIDERLSSISWLDQVRGKSFYAVGGIWRAIARIHIQQTKYPLHLIDNYSMDVSAARDLTEVISRQSSVSLRRNYRAARRRSETLPMAALVLDRLLKHASPHKLIFSGYGLREGLFFDLLPPKMRDEDPLISACAGFAKRSGRFSLHGREIADWVQPVLTGLSSKMSRMLDAAALLSDIGWTEHPDYRALHSFIRILRLPIAGITHHERVLLALAIFVRYEGRRNQYEVQQVHSLLSEQERQSAATIGVSLRLAHVLSGGVPGLLSRTRLGFSEGGISLDLTSDRQLFSSSAVESIVRDLAKEIGVSYTIR